MGLTYRRGLKLGPVRLNLSGSGAGLSVGGLGTRVGTTGTGRRYAYTNLGMGLRHIATLPKAKRPFPAGMVDLSGGDEFWFDVEGESANQDAIAAAVGDIERWGGDQATIPVFLFRGENGELGVAVSAGATFREVGTVPAATEALRAFVARLGDGEPSVGKCSALVFNEEGQLGLKLNLRREHLADGKPSIMPVVISMALIGVASALVRSIFGRRR